MKSSAKSSYTISALKENNMAAKLILASASPRRKGLMEKVGYEFDVIVSDVDESKFDSDNIEPTEFAKQLAYAKASDVAKKHPDAIVIGADTIADFDGEIIGKADNENHAQEITRKLFSKPHKVTTGLAIIQLPKNIKIVESDTTIVYPKNMDENQIVEHIESGTWQGKAGAYAIQETGDKFVERIEGSLTNVMGLPMELLEKMLLKIS